MSLPKNISDTPSPAINRFVVNDLDRAVLATRDDRNIVIGAKFARLIVAIVADVFDGQMAIEEKYAALGRARLHFEMMRGGAIGNGWTGNRDLARHRR